MARYQASIETPRSRDQAFAYLSDFATTSEWDPGVIHAERLSPGVTGEGAEFRLLTRFLGRTATLTYRTVEYDPPHALTLLGESASVVSRDRITFDATDHGTRVTYTAELTLKGMRRIADPLLALAFHRVGERALAGLRRSLGSVAPRSVEPA